MRRACWWLGVSRSWLGYASRRQEEQLVSELKDLAAMHPRYGYRRLGVLLNRQRAKQGLAKVNRKRVRRLCVKHGLSLKLKRRRKRRGIGCGVPCRAEFPHHVWAYDFVEDRTETGRKLRILTVEDEFTRLCLEIEVEYRMNARFVGQTLLRLFAAHGTPAFLRSDNGPEFIAGYLMRLLAIHGVEARHIEPGSPWQNGLNERFNGSYRDECANLHTFHNRDHARALSKLYQREYNEQRPHSSLGYQTPTEFAASWRQQETVGCADLGRCPRPRDLSPEAPSGAAKASGAGDENGPSMARPQHPQVVPVGAPVASQQSRTLRGNETKVSNQTKAGKDPAQNRKKQVRSL